MRRNSAVLQHLGLPTLLRAICVAMPLSLAFAGDAPRFVDHPQSILVEVGETLRLSCLATGTPPISYIWQKGAVFLTDQTNATLVISNAQLAHAGSYAVVASNDDGLERSEAASVVVYTNDPCNFPWVWLKTYRDDGLGCAAQHLSAMTTDSLGNIYLTGPACGDSPSLTLKLDPEGQLLWRATYGHPSNNADYATDLAVDTAGNCFVTGYSSPIGGGVDAVTIKYGTDGEQLWMTRWTNGNARRVVVDAAGCAYITSGERGTLKHSPEGNPLWTNSHGGFFLAHSPSDDAVVVAPGYGTVGMKKISAEGSNVWTVPVTNVQALCVDDTGHIYTASGYGFNWSASQGDIQTVKLAPDGVPGWTRLYNSPFNSIEAPKAIALDPQGNVFIAGVVYRTHAQQAQQAGDLDILVLKYSPNGDLLWANRFNDSANQEEIPSAIVADDEGNVLVAGTTEYEPTGEGREALLLKYAPDGKLLWTSRYRNSGSGLGHDYFLRLALDNDGRLTVAGQTEFVNKHGAARLSFLVAQFDQ